MSPLEIVGVLLGIGMLYFIVLAIKGREFDAEAPKYEMLDMEPPRVVPLPVGKLTPMDRIIRLGLIGASFYYAARIGWTEPFGLLLTLLGAYFTITGLWGKDPLYTVLARRKNQNQSLT